MQVGSAASPGSAPPGEERTGPQGRAGLVVRRAARLMARHKLPTAIAAAFAVAVIAVSLATSGTSGPPPDPVAPGFTLNSLTAPGQHITLSQYRGKPLIVNFWASWCEPCQKETPLLASWYTRQHGHVVLVGLDENDSAASALAFARAKGVSYPIGVDPNLGAANAYGVTGLPQTFFLNAQHRIVLHTLGAVTPAELAKGLRLMGASSAKGSAPG